MAFPSGSLPFALSSHATNEIIGIIALFNILAGDIRRNIAYTTYARILSNTLESASQVEGLFRSGFPDLRCKLRHCTLDMIASRDYIYEFYNPETRANPLGAAAIFGWSAAIFINLAIQETGLA